jgi:hypothetical protein
MSWIKNILVTLLAFVIIFAILEVVTRIVWGHPLDQHQRVMLFESGENFVNIGEGFKYYPNKSIRSSTYYITPDNHVVNEYDYIIKTNNLGLVQKKNIDLFDTVDIFMGDSFTEGQGADPWFYEFENNYKKFNKVINGGLLGTGPLQWELLSNHLQDEYFIKYNTVNVIFVSPDVNRPIWNFSDKLLNCLRYQKCINTFSQFYGYEFHKKTQQDLEEDVLKYYIQTPRKLLEKSAFLLTAYLVIKRTLNIKNDKGVVSLEINQIKENNLVAIKSLVNKGSIKGKVYWIPTKQEVNDSKQSSLTKEVVLWLENNNIDVVLCNDLIISDFHIHDMHPNKKGYVKIRRCIGNS